MSYFKSAGPGPPGYFPALCNTTCLLYLNTSQTRYKLCIISMSGINYCYMKKGSISIISLHSFYRALAFSSLVPSGIFILFYFLIQKKKCLEKYHWQFSPGWNCQKALFADLLSLNWIALISSTAAPPQPPALCQKEKGPALDGLAFNSQERLLLPASPESLDQNKFSPFNHVASGSSGNAICCEICFCICD